MKIKNLNLNGKEVHICVPITSINKENIIEDVKSAVQSKAEVIEWRVDCFEGAKDIEQVIDILKEIQINLGDKVLLFTYRTSNEGGNGNLETSEYMLLLKTAILSKLVDIVDIELLLGDTIINSIVNHAHMCNVKILISNHDMDSTPRYDVIENRINLMYEKGADIAKVSYMPKNEEDVKVLYQVAKDLNKDRPYLLISMGELGKVTRLEAKKLGSCFTFASLNGKVSAPGQISVEEICKTLKK